MSKHTPGPWEWLKKSPHVLNAAGQAKDGSTVDDESIVLMMTHRTRAHLKEANANLIAAAPSLLEACTRLTLGENIPALDWLQCLIARFEDVEKEATAHGYEDEDPQATTTMLLECKQLLSDLRAAVARVEGDA